MELFSVVLFLHGIIASAVRKGNRMEKPIALMPVDFTSLSECFLTRVLFSSLVPFDLHGEICLAKIAFSVYSLQMEKPLDQNKGKNDKHQDQDQDHGFITCCTFLRYQTSTCSPLMLLWRTAIASFPASPNTQSLLDLSVGAFNASH